MILSTWRKRLAFVPALALALMVANTADAQQKGQKQNLVQLIQSSQSIVAGTVRKVSDGIDANGLPYTEVTIAVGASPKGGIEQGDYTFRQFGLTAPRTLPNGKRMLMLTPPEFPRWRQDEYVVAFLYHPAARTGLQTTSGLAQGKLDMVNGKLVNRYGNAGLFDHITVADGALPEAERQLLGGKEEVRTETLLSLIRHVVDGQMIERGMVR